MSTRATAGGAHAVDVPCDAEICSVVEDRCCLAFALPRAFLTVARGPWPVALILPVAMCGALFHG
jgi:hypothetical protein